MNVLTDRQRERIVERLRAGESLRKIERETGHRRETVARVKRSLEETSTQRAWTARRSRCEPFRGVIERELAGGMAAWAIYRRLIGEFGFTGSYGSVKRYVRRLRPAIGTAGTVVDLATRRGGAPVRAVRAAA